MRSNSSAAGWLCCGEEAENDERVISRGTMIGA